MAPIKTPGVYPEELLGSPLTISSADTAVPCFIGFTQKAQWQQPDDLLLVPRKINSLAEYEQYFGKAVDESGITISLDASVPKAAAAIHHISPYLFYYSMQAYFNNSGISCYVISTGIYDTAINTAALQAGLTAAATVNEITLLVFPDAMALPTAEDCYSLYKMGLLQCNTLRNRFLIMDVWIDKDNTADNITVFRSADMGEADILKYGAIYYPQLYMTLPYQFTDISVLVNCSNDPALSGTLHSLKIVNALAYNKPKLPLQTCAFCSRSAA